MSYEIILTDSFLKELNKLKNKSIEDRRFHKLKLTYRIGRSFFPRKIPLMSKIEVSHNFAIELGIFQSWQKFGRATARSEPPNSSACPIIRKI